MVGGYRLEGTTKDAVRSLSVLVKGLTTTVIWIVVFSPFWGGGLAVLVVLGRFAAARRRRRARQPEPEEPQVSGVETCLIASHLPARLDDEEPSCPFCASLGIR